MIEINNSITVYSPKERLKQLAEYYNSLEFTMFTPLTKLTITNLEKEMLFFIKNYNLEPLQLKMYNI